MTRPEALGGDELEVRRMSDAITVRAVRRSDRDTVITTLAEAFARDPLFTSLFGPDVAATRRSSAGMTSFLGFIVTRNRLSGGTIWGAYAGERMLGCMLVEPPHAACAVRTAAVAARFVPVLCRLGIRRTVALARMHARIAAIEPVEPHHYLRMIGVRRDSQGLGLGSLLLRALIDEVLRHPGSLGIALDTENPANVPLYRHWGFRLLGRFEAAGMDIAVLYRPVRDAGLGR